MHATLQGFDSINSECVASAYIIPIQLLDDTSYRILPDLHTKLNSDDILASNK